MRNKVEGQSMVEMALLMPLLLIFLFAIIEFGYYIYGYATVYQSARNAAEVAANAPPYPAMLTEEGTPTDEGGDDPCILAIRDAAEKGAVLFPRIRRAVRIRYPEYMRDDEGNILPRDGRRLIGHPIEVSIRYTLQPLTPLWNLVPVIGNNGRMVVQTTARRTIESYGLDPSVSNLSPCKEPAP